MATQSSTAAIGRGIHTSFTILDKLAPGGSLEWTVTASGLGGISDLQLQDILGDGQRVDTAFSPQVVIRRSSMTLFSGNLVGWTGVRSTTTATTAINFDLSATLRAAGLSGGMTDDSTISVTFHSQILPLYSATTAPLLGRVLGQGDPLVNTAVFSGTVAGVLASSSPVVLAPTLPTSLLTTSIYAVNGVPVTGTVYAAYGDIVTYRMQIQLPLTAAHDVQLWVAAPGLVGTPAGAASGAPVPAFIFDARAVNATPASGHAQFGPSGSYKATLPLLVAATDASGNAVLEFNFGDIQPVYGSGSGTIDLLVSAVLQPGAVAPGAPLALQATETEENSFGVQVATTALPVGLTLEQPSLRIQTATVYASNDNATWTGTGGPVGYSPDFGQFGDVISSAGLAREPFADRLSGVDAGDDVTFVIAVENLAPGAKAYGTIIRATMPPGFVLPADGAGLWVTDGAGNPLTFSGNLFDPQGGLTLDPSAPLAGYNADSGLNILLISYTLTTADQLDLSVPLHDSLAQIVSYTTTPGGSNQAPMAPAAYNTATTEVATLQPTVQIALTATSNPSTGGTLLTLGEVATFVLTVTLPGGLSRALDIAPMLPPGFTALSAQVLSVGANITVQTQATDGAGGILFGDTLNTGAGQNTADNQIQIAVTAQPSLVPAGPAPHMQTVQAVVNIGTSGAITTATASLALTIAAPAAPTVTLALVSSGAATLLNGQAATFRITVTLPAGYSGDFRILDSLPAGLAYVPGSKRIVQAGGVTSAGTATLAAPSESVAGPLLTLDFGAVTAATATSQVIVELQARLVAAAPGATLTSSATASTGYASSVPAMLTTIVGNAAPTLAGLPIAEAARDDTSLAAFAGLTLTDPDAGQTQTLRIKLSNPANGILTNPGIGSYDPVAGTYIAIGTAAAVAAAAAGLRFVPTLHQASLGQSVPTDLSVQAQDSAGGMSTLFVIRVTTAATDIAPVIRNAAPGQPIIAGVPVPLFTGLMLSDADAGQLETLTIQFSNPAIGVLSGAGPGQIDPVTGAFTATGTLAALTAAAGRLLFTASQPAGAQTALTITVDDGAGGVARDTSVVAISPGTLAAWPGVGQFLAGAPPANIVAVNPAGPNLLLGTGGRDAYFIDGNAPGSHWDTVTGFAGADTVVLWGFQPGRSTITWSDNDGPAGNAGRTLHASMPGTGGTNNLTFAGLTSGDSARFAISTGRVEGLGYLSITAPS